MIKMSELEQSTIEIYKALLLYYRKCNWGGGTSDLAGVRAKLSLIREVWDIIVFIQNKKDGRAIPVTLEWSLSTTLSKTPNLTLSLTRFGTHWTSSYN